MTSFAAWHSSDHSNGQAAGFTHPAVFYRDTAEYLAATAPFVLAGLTAGEPVAVAVPEKNLSALRAEVAEADPANVDRVRWLDMAEAGRNPGRIIPGVLRAFADQHPTHRVRIIGEPIWATRSAAEYPACVQHEAMINTAFHDRAATILCPYDATSLDQVALADAAVTHPVLVYPDGYRASAEFSPELAVRTYNLPFAEPDQVETMTVSADDIPLARQLVVDKAVDAGVAGRRLGDVAIVVTELVTNSVEHGGGTATMRIWTEDGQFVCEVSDTGRLDNPMAGRLPVPVWQRRGRGLLLVNNCADLVRSYRDELGTVTRAHFRR